jgi:hypothetical protein
VAQRNDQVFQLSLTEIAFTIAFLLLLLLGYLVFKEQADRKAAEDALREVQGIERATSALDKAKSEFAEVLRSFEVSAPDEVISRLIAAEDVRAERDSLRTRVDELDAKLTALAELQKLVEAAGSAAKQGVAAAEVASALALQSEIRTALAATARPLLSDIPPEASQATSVPQVVPSQSRPAAATSTFMHLSEEQRSRRNEAGVALVRQALKTNAAFRHQAKSQLLLDIPPGREVHLVEEVVRAAKGYAELSKSGSNPDVIRKENSDLRGQVAFLKNRLDARGGRDWPPCWADEDGKVEFLFSIDLRADAVVVTGAWPAKREPDAKALPGITEVLAGPLSFQDFQTRVRGIFDWSKRHDPQCRHYVHLRSSISDAVQSDRARLMVENYFYKAEVRR